MTCKHNQETYRTRRKWWERLLGVQRAARCADCGGRIRYFEGDRGVARGTPTAARSVAQAKSSGTMPWL
jgi:hypothetical protein